MKLAFAAAAAATLAIIAAPAAQAFTLDEQSNTTAKGAARYSDPDARFDGADSGRGQVIQQGNATIRFGGPEGGSFDQRYDTKRMFDPLGRPGDGR
jgi:hypothetical protein